MKNTYSQPLRGRLAKGCTVADVERLLVSNGCMEFPQLGSGLFPAENFDDRTTDQTGMSDAWLRDSACVGLNLMAAGEARQVPALYEAIVARLSLVDDGALSASKRRQSPPVRYRGDDSLPVYEWANTQNDALGYALLFVGRYVRGNPAAVSDRRLQAINATIDYLERIQYWRCPDSGHWEEVKKVNASSIGAVVAGLKAVSELPNVKSVQVMALVEKGEAALTALLPYEARGDFERSEDAAQLFLIEPLNVLSPKDERRIIARCEKSLKGDIGFRRYVGDSYWAPDYRRHFGVGARTADFSDPEMMQKRDSYLVPKKEAQWTLFDPVLCTYYARCYLTDAHPDSYSRATHYLTRALLAVVEHTTSDGRIVWRIPELFFEEDGEWVPNDHLGLLWTQANLLAALTMYKRTFGAHSTIRIL